MDEHDQAARATPQDDLSALLWAPWALPPDVALLRLEGAIQGHAAVRLGRWLDAAVQGDHVTCGLHLGGVTGWSLLAEATVLDAARQLRARDRTLVLLAPSAALRAQSRLDLFERVPTLPAP